MARILLVDGAPEWLQPVAAALRANGHTLWIARGLEEGRNAVLSSSYDVILTSDHLPDGASGELLAAAQAIDSSLPVVLFSSERQTGDYFDVIPTDLPADQVGIVARRAIEHGMLVRENLLLKSAAEDVDSAHLLHGQSSAIRSLRARIDEIASSTLPVLITGEAGTGKQVVARIIHANSPRRSGPFVRFGAARLSNLLEFGADAAQSSLLQAAREGSVLLDEIGDISSYAEPALLQLIQSAELNHAKASVQFSVHARVLLTARGTFEDVANPSRFRFSWVQRLDLVRVHVPRLSDRKEDIPGLCDLFCRRASVELKTPPRFPTPAALDKLCNYSFPGNVRELRNLIYRAYMITAGSELGPEDFLLPGPEVHDSGVVASHPMLTDSTKSFDLLAYLQRTEEELIRRALNAAGGAQAEAARRMGISRSLLAYKLQKYGIRPIPR